MSKIRFTGIFRVFKNIGAFIITKSFFKQLGIAIVLAVVLFFGTFQLLGVLTHHGEGLSVPNFAGYNLNEAIKIAEENDLKIEINDSVYNAPGKKGTVIAQTPPADFKVKRGRTIHVVIKTFMPEQIDMPDFTGVSLIQAKADIETYGLKIGKLRYVPDIATNNVLEQMYKGKPIAPGTRIEKNSKIDLVLGLGKSSEPVPVPDLIGDTKVKAVQQVTDNSLNVGVMMFDETVITSEDTASAIVWKQSPLKRRYVIMGSTVDLWLTLDTTRLKQKQQTLDE